MFDFDFEDLAAIVAALDMATDSPLMDFLVNRTETDADNKALAFIKASLEPTEQFLKSVANDVERFKTATSNSEKAVIIQQIRNDFQKSYAKIEASLLTKLLDAITQKGQDVESEKETPIN